jgi:hypothetical protein
VPEFPTWRLVISGTPLVEYLRDRRIAAARRWR